MNSTQFKKAIDLIAQERAQGTKRANERADKMEALLRRRDYSGAFGSICELASHTEKSRKNRVSAQGKADTYIKMLVNGKIRYVAVEVKTNGGRIESLYSAGAPKFVAYSMNVNNSLAHYETSVKLFPTAVFLEMLETLNAIKSTNGKNPERAVQAVSKKLYIAVSDWVIPYEPDTVYTPDDFEGLTW